MKRSILVYLNSWPLPRLRSRSVNMGMQSITFAVGPIPIPEDVRFVVRELVPVRSLAPRLDPVCFNVAAVNTQIKVVIIIVEPNSLFLIHWSRIGVIRSGPPNILALPGFKLPGSGHCPVGGSAGRSICTFRRYYLLYIYQPVKIPIPALTIMLTILTALEPALIRSFSSERRRILLPTNTGTSSFGEIIAVASPYINGWTVGKVETAPLHIEYGRGHSRIMHSNLRPSYLSVKDSAANLVSRSIKRWTNWERMVRDTMKEHVDPRTLAVV